MNKLLNHWRLDTTDGDFFLVCTPSFVDSQIVRAYHLELLTRVRSLPHHARDEADTVLFENLRGYYQKIADRLSPNFYPALLNPQSRHQFFVAAKRSNDYWLSGLELLMGYDYLPDAPDVSHSPRITSGSAEIDLLAELLLQCPQANIAWLAKTFSLEQLAGLVRQISDRARGQEALDEVQRQIDLDAFQSSGEKSLNSAGFIFPEVTN